MNKEEYDLDEILKQLEEEEESNEKVKTAGYSIKR